MLVRTKKEYLKAFDLENPSVLASVLIPAYNAENTIVDAVQEVILIQTHTNFELIVGLAAKIQHWKPYKHKRPPGDYHLSKRIQRPR